MFMLCVDDWKTPVKLDAPVSGSVIAAEAGTLTFMVSILFKDLALHHGKPK